MAVPVYTPPIDSAPSTPDINALRSAQLRASRQQRQGKLFGRTLLVLLADRGDRGGGIDLRSRLPVPDRVGPGTDPVVDEIQTERGAEFEHTGRHSSSNRPPTTPLTIGRLVIDDSWLDSVPVWRALGLTTGEPTSR